MDPHIYEGNWEEILAHANELSGRRVRLFVLPDDKPNRMLDEVLAPVLQEADARFAERVPPVELPGDAHVAVESHWAAGLLEKYRAQGFRL